MKKLLILKTDLGEKIIQSGYKIIYEPSASVFHHHGIHQDGNQVRLRNVVNIIQSYSKEIFLKEI